MSSKVQLLLSLSSVVCLRDLIISPAHTYLIKIRFLIVSFKWLLTSGWSFTSWYPMNIDLFTLENWQSASGRWVIISEDYRLIFLFSIFYSYSPSSSVIGSYLKYHSLSSGFKILKWSIHSLFFIDFYTFLVNLLIQKTINLTDKKSQ